mmetsp:Transcript_53497/g.88869  ORF Transcript_53497/g.88869 Transcript_53497/m.88869 type:complete len:376 (+) Transcript_53497:90-1217(+)
MSMGEEFIFSLPLTVQRRVQALEKLNDEHTKLEEQFQKELRELELKYHKLYEPLYDKRAQIATGAHEPTDAEAGLSLEELKKKKAEGSLEVTDVDKEVPTTDKPKSIELDEETIGLSTKGIPDFWLTSMKNNDQLADHITEKDEQVLKFLTDIKASPLVDRKGFSLEFVFSENPFFTNTILSKSYYMLEEEELILDHAEGTKIDWKPGKNVTVKLMKKKTSGRGRKPAKTITKMEPCDSFFNFFNPPEVPDAGESLDEKDEEELQNALEMDYDLGTLFKERIVPHAIKWYTGEALKDEDYEEDDEEDEEDEEDDDDEEADDDDEDEDEDDDEGEGKKPSPKNGKAGGRGARGPAGRGAGGGPAGAPQQPPECKQQ